MNHSVAKPRIGVIGLGALGEPISALLLQAGYSIAVYDVRAEPMQKLQALGATTCAHPAQLAQCSELIFSFVADAAQTQRVIAGESGILNHLRAGTVFATGSTLGIDSVRQCAQMLATQGSELMDMPISGGIVAARAGQLSLMVGGAAETVERLRPILTVFASDITHTGGVGTGQAAKLAHQLVFGVQVVALLEGLAVAAAGGVKPAIMRQVLGQGLANSAVLQAWPDLGPRWKGMLQPLDEGMPLPNLRKDLHLVAALAQRLGVATPLLTQASIIADSGTATGSQDPDL